MTNVLQLAGKREVFWDDYLIDTEKTTAAARIHAPREAGFVMTFDAPWEGNSTNYFCLLKEPDGLIRMYYTGWHTVVGEENVVVSDISHCYAESRDGGLTWVKPKLGLREFNGSRENNIILDKTDSDPSGIMVFRDDNPRCPAGERYKGLTWDSKNDKGEDNWALWCFVSPDGIHFTRGWMISDQCTFDTLNNAIWDAERGIYHCFVRDFHGGSQDGEVCEIRDIRYMSSTDFHNWSEPKLLDFGDAEDYALYTNCVTIYERAPQIFVGFPSRYMGRGAWTANYDRLTGAEERRRRMNWGSRIGLTTTDCVFMCSRDATHWYRFEEAFMRPGPERPDNWIYGDCYPSLGMLETPGEYGRESELSLFAAHSHFIGDVARLMRYTIRKDGFVSLNAPYAGAVVTTKPFVFDGKGIALNFSTSARGYLYVTLTAADGTVAKSCEIFGDACDRIIDFDCDLSAFAGKETVMEINMRDADVYAVKFD